MKIHRLLAEGCVTFLRDVFENGRVLDHVVAAGFKANPRWGKRDRNFVASSVWEIVRWRRALAFVADSDDPRALLAAHWQGEGLEIPDWWAWDGASTADMTSRRAALPDQPRAIRESVPDWLDARASNELGDAWDAELHALNQRAPVCVRVNPLLTTPHDAIAWLASEGVRASMVDNVSDALLIDGILPPRLVDDGRLEIQDVGSQLVAPLLDLAPGMSVIDACAGAGGKTLHLAALMEGEGRILALDVQGRKLSELKRRAGRAGVSPMIRTETWEADTLRRYREQADRVLIDAPCSGLGTLRRQPDLKWRLDEPQLEKTRRLQRRLLDHYHELLKPDGKLVYATCSILPSENGGQIRALLERDPRWQVETEETISPATTGWDGFYVARLSRR